MSEAKPVKLNNILNKVGTTVKQYDWVLLMIVGILLLFGLIMLYSTSSYDAQIDPDINDGLYYVKKQIIAIFVGLVAMVVVSFFSRELLKKVAIPAYVISLILVVCVIAQKDAESHGATRWIYFGSFSFQPSELAKIAVVLLTAYLICKFSAAEEERRKKINTPCLTRKEEREREELKQIARKEEITHLLIAIAGAGLATVLVAHFNDDLGTAIIIFAIGFVMIFSTNKQKGLLFIILAVIAAAAVIMVLTSEFRQNRVKAWWSPEDYADDESYQVMQGLYAICSGGLMGKGLGMSTQKISSIPEARNDMIFSIVCEELGIIGGILLIILFTILIWKMKTVFDGSKDLFDKLIVVGVCTHIAVQAFINMAVVTGTIPNTGVPLPFISYGGTAVSLQLAEIGLILGVSVRNAEKNESPIAFKNKKLRKRQQAKRAYRYK